MKINVLLMRFLLLPLFIFVLSSSANAADGDFFWAHAFGHDLDDIGYSTAVDAAGNVYMTGYFQGTDVDFDPGPGEALLSSAGNNDIFITKMSSTGSLIWARRFGSFSDDEGLSIAVDAAGNVYTTGYFQGTVDFDPSVAGTHALTEQGQGDIFVSKLDSSGNYVGAWAFGGNGIDYNGSAFDYGYGIHVDGGENIFIAGYFQNTLYFNDGSGAVTTNQTSAGEYDIFIAKIAVNGSLVWVDRIGGTATDVGLGLSAYSSGHLYLTGHFQGTVDFDPGPGPANNLTSSGATDDIYVCKLDTDGNYVWARKMGGPSEDKGQAVAVDRQGNILVTGWFNGSADFDEDGTPDLTSNGSADVFIAKLDSSGSLTWARQIGGNNADVGYGIAVDGSGNVYTTGGFQGTDVDFDPNTGSYPLSSVLGPGPDFLPSIDIFISKLDSGGNFVWAKGMGGILDDYGYGIAVDGFANVYMTGYFRETADFDPGPGTHDLVAAGALSRYDIFISKLSGDKRPFPWPMFLPALIGGNRQP